MDKSLFFVAILPDENTQKEITGFKKTAEKLFNTKRALTSPPHITLIPPFKWEKEKINDIKNILSVFCSQNEKFEIELKNFNAFPPRVIYVDVVSSGKLEKSYRDINHLWEKELSIPFRYKDKEYHPHMTIAFRDLKEKIFPEAWSFFKEKKYTSEFEADALTLLGHNGKKWETISEFPFGKYKK